MQTTLVLLKPDCVTKGNSGEVLRRLESAGFRIRGCKMLRLDANVLKEHYAHIASQPFYPAVEKLMVSAPVIAVAMEGKNAIDRIRTLTGPTDSRKADKGTIRGDLGVDMMVNVIHASDGPESATAELDRFFSPSELFDYQRVG